MSSPSLPIISKEQGQNFQRAIDAHSRNFIKAKTEPRKPSPSLESVGQELARMIVQANTSYSGGTTDDLALSDPLNTLRNLFYDSMGVLQANFAKVISGFLGESINLHEEAVSRETKLSKLNESVSKWVRGLQDGSLTVKTADELFWQQDLSEGNGHLFALWSQDDGRTIESFTLYPPEDGQYKTLKSIGLDDPLKGSFNGFRDLTHGREFIELLLKEANKTIGK